MAIINGYVKDKYNKLTSNIVVSVYRKDNGAFLGGCITGDGVTPFTEGDPYYDNVVLLLPMQGTNDSTIFTDYSKYNITMTPTGEARIRTNQFKYGNSSAYFDGYGDCVYGYIDPLNYDDFTIEFKGLLNDADNGNDWGRFFHIGTNDSGSITVFKNNSLNPTNIGYTVWASSSLGYGDWSNSYMSNNVWYDYCITRYGDLFSYYVNGVLQNTSNAHIDITAYNLCIAARTASIEWMNCYMQDFRITKGYCRYKSNYTVPSKLLPTTRYNSGGDLGKYTIPINDYTGEIDLIFMSPYSDKNNIIHKAMII